jgi:NitT/TauT family transport system substrate-binding protein
LTAAGGWSILPAQFETERGRVKSAALLAFLLLAVTSVVEPASAQIVTVGTTSSTSDAPIFIADKKGYFRAEGLEVKVANFRSAADMVAPLGAGQIEVGAGSASAGLYNAVARGIRLRIVADKASSPPGYGATKILVRKDHVDSGRYKEINDLKGMKFAMNAPGVSNTSTLNTLLRSVGLKYSDVETVDMPLPDHVAALKNKSVDAAASVEPAPALAIRSGDAILVRSDDEILPHHQIAVLLYSEQFALRQPQAARRFMHAYIRAVRFYNDALKDGRFEGRNADEVIAVLSEATPLKSRDVYKMVTPTGMNPDGRVNEASLAYDLAFYVEQGLVKGAVNLADVVDHSFVELTLGQLGRYRQ